MTARWLAGTVPRQGSRWTAKARAARDVAEGQWKAEDLKATSRVNIEYAEMTAEVHKYDYEQALEANRKQPDSISKSEVRRRWAEEIELWSSTLSIPTAPG